MLLPETPENQVIHLQKRIEQKIDTFNQENQNKINVIFGISGYTSEDKSLDNIIMRALKKSNKKGRK
jgi:PleD family two-component response regulator